jgi:hypothetical protein
MFNIKFEDVDRKWEGLYKLTTRHTIYDTGEGTVKADVDVVNAINMRVVYCKDKNYDPIEPTVYNLKPDDFVKYSVPITLKIDQPPPPAPPLIHRRMAYTAACKDAVVELSGDTPPWVTLENEVELFIWVPANIELGTYRFNVLQTA